MERPYATLDGVRAYLGAIEGLRALREERLAAGARFERMPGYCVLGRYLLTEDGRFGELTGSALAAARGAPDVTPLEAFARETAAAFGPAWRLTYRVPAALAPHDRACEGCGRGWTLADCHDIEEESVEGGVLPFHPECLRGRRRGDWLWWAEDVLARAGFPDGGLEMQDAEISGGAFPWFRLTTPRGGIHFGRLAPGFGIEWSETGCDMTDRFCRPVGSIAGHAVWTEPPVERGPFHVRPKDATYLIRYLSRLREALGL